MTFNFKSHNDKRRQDANIAEKYDFQDFWETLEFGALTEKWNLKKKIMARKSPETHKSHKIV